ncbi:organomercurial lyase [Staphylococcus debuckii]|uniref:Organomercurial lyase n=1 Tax=Staphylococcus debuckii TaxID=2044912 RepID=A0ABU9F0I9_9STAP
MKTFNFKAQLNPTEQHLRHELIQQILNHPTKTIPFKSKYQALLDKHVLNIEDDQNTCLYPFSLKSNHFKVTLTETKQTIYAMCAVDAIGVCDTLKTPIKINTVCAETNTPIQLSVENNKIHNLTDYPDLRVLYKDLCPDSQCSVNCCPYIQFFKDEEALEQYYNEQIGHAPTISEDTAYHSLSLQQAREVAQELFA